MSIRVAIVDDHPIVVTGLRGLLSAEPDLVVAGEAGSLAAARELLAATPTDVVLLDVRLPDGSGFELLTEAHEADRSPAFVVLSSFETPQHVEAALRQGASGYLLKTAPGTEILSAIRTAASGGTTFRRDQLKAVAGTGTPLTERDREVVRLVVEGLSNDEMAQRLGISTKTIEARLTRLFARSGVVSRTELAVRAEREQWLDTLPSTGGGARSNRA